MHNWKKAILRQTDTMNDVIQVLNNESFRIALIVDNNERLVGTVTDGDIRRGMLKNFSMNSASSDFMFTKPDEYPFAILYFTGSAEFNVRMREDLLKRGLTLNEYSLKDSKTKKKVDQEFNNEKDIFEYIKYDYVEPENR